MQRISSLVGPSYSSSKSCSIFQSRCSYAQKKFKQLGDLKAPHPLTKWNSYGGRPIEATVIRTSSAKSIMVEYFNYARDPTYQISLKRRIRLMVHDENNICHVGDTVLIAQSRPYSKQKHHVVREIIQKDPGVLFLSKHPELYVSPLQIRSARREEMDVRSLTKEEKMERDAKRLEKQQQQQQQQQQQKAQQKAAGS